MRTEEIVKILSQKKRGQIYTVEMQRPGKTLKTAGDVRIEKRTRMQGLLTDYANRTPVKEAVAAGTRAMPEKPAYIDKVLTVDGVTTWIGHKGEEYLPIVLHGDNSTSEWLLDGQPVPLEEISHLLLAEETAKRSAPKDGQVPFISVRVNNIVAIR